MTTYEALQIEKKLINNEKITNKEYQDYKKTAEDAQNKIINTYGEYMINTINRR